MVVESDTVGYEYAVSGDLLYFPGYFFQFRGIPDHIPVDPGQGSYIGGNFTSRIHQGGEFTGNFPVFDPENGNFGDTVPQDPVARCFYIDNRINAFHRMGLFFSEKY